MVAHGMFEVENVLQYRSPQAYRGILTPFLGPLLDLMSVPSARVSLG